MRRFLFTLVLAGCAGTKDPETGQVGQDSGQARAADADRDGYAEDEDCDDQDAAVHPGADEVCDGLDNDCDQLVDDMDDSLSGATWYTDADGDAYGDDASGVNTCAPAEGAVQTGGDCDDADPAYHPGAAEDDCANPADYNCDGSTGFDDADGDGFGACEECDDADPLSYPGADETCDGADNDCDTLIDDADADVSGGDTWYGDADGDGYGDDGVSVTACAQPEGYAASGGDCDDVDPAYNPGAAETDCADPNDYNCDGSVAYADADGDGVAACLECDDGDAEISPEATEICDGKDNDCDGYADDADSEVKGATDWYADADEDGYGDADAARAACEAPDGYVALSTDCDDADGEVHPGATEACDDQDNDCDGLTDDADSAVSGTSTWYRDADSDTYGGASTTTACDAPAGYVARTGDCLDGNSAVNPAATETCDDLDNDCDGLTDDADSAVSGTSTWYRDNDSDGYGGATTKAACDKPSGYAASGGDCDDTDGNINPDETEICNEEDDDCDGLYDDDDPDLEGAFTAYTDGDGDGYGDESSPVELCFSTTGYTTEGGDCDDSDEDVNPDATDDCDAVDNDCNGYADDGDECPCYVEYYDDHPYMYCTSYNTWSGAKSTCEDYGYTLVSIDSSAEDSEVYDNTRSYSRYSWWWIGYSDSASEDTWVWTDGEATTYTDWASGEPDDSSYYGQDCAIFAPSASSDWYDTYCEYYLFYVCEAE